MAAKMRVIMGLPIALLLLSGCGIDDRNQQFAQCKLQYDKRDDNKSDERVHLCMEAHGYKLADDSNCSYPAISRECFVPTDGIAKIFWNGIPSK
jgi:hypothetical protein